MARPFLVVLPLVVFTLAVATQAASPRKHPKPELSRIVTGAQPDPADAAVAPACPGGQSPLATPKGKKELQAILETPFTEEAPAAGAAASAAAAGDHWDGLVTQLRTACADQDIAALTKTILGKMHVTSAAPFYTAELEAPVDTDSVITRAGECNKANNDLFYAVRKLAANPAFVTEAETLFAGSRPQICYAIVFAGVLDRLGELAAKDFTVISYFVDASAKLRNNNWRAYATKFCAKKGPFGAVKQFSVEKPFYWSWIPTLQAVADAGQHHKDQEASGSFGVPLNIAEAMITDYHDGFPQNAAVGSRLVETALLPFPTHIDRSEGNSDPRSLELFYEWPPTPKAWSDLYQVWNMAFTVRFDDWTVMYAKLLNPYVACYNAPHDPARYIFRRAVSLLMTIVAFVDELVHDKPTNDSPKWSPEFRRAFGAANAQSAARFRQATLAQATPAVRNQIQNPTGWLWPKFVKMYDDKSAKEKAVVLTPLNDRAHPFPSSPKTPPTLKTPKLRGDTKKNGK